MTRQDIERIIQAQGYRCQFQERVGKHGNGRSQIYVYAWQPGKHKHGRVLGKLEEICLLDQDTFAELVRAKWAGQKT